MRHSCPSCGLKHVACSIILSHEVVLGYPHHFVYVVGHLAQAEEELVKDYPAMASFIRQVRIDYMESGILDGEELGKKIYEFYKENRQTSPA